jgi:hypothetical protein
MTNWDMKGLVFAVVTCRVCDSVRLLQLPVVMSYSFQLIQLSIQNQCIITNTWQYLNKITLRILASISLQEFGTQCTPGLENWFTFAIN